MRPWIKRFITFNIGFCFSSLCFSAYAQPLDDKLIQIYINTYIYAYPLVVMGVTENVMTNVPSAQERSGVGLAPVNQFFHMRKFPDPSYVQISRPSMNTLYSMAWLDLHDEPRILYIPDMKGRFYVLPMIDGWTNIFVSLGTRTNTGPGYYVIVGPHWNKAIPTGLKKIQSPTDIVWIFGRIFTKGPSDYPEVNKLQNQLKLIPLSAFGIPYEPRTDIPTDPRIDMMTSPIDQVSRMKALDFLNSFAELMKINPPAANDTNIIMQMRQIGIIPGQSYDPKLDPQQIAQIENAFNQARNQIVQESQKFGERDNGWVILPRDVGRFATNYLTRAAVAYFALGLNLPEDAIYPNAILDVNLQRLNGNNQYLIHFDKQQLPPVKAFWSLTVYHEGRLTENPINRYSLGSPDDLKYNSDGSLDIYLQHNPTEYAKLTNWLPIPAENFNLILRLYWPQPAALDGTWVPPGVKKLQNNVSAQRLREHSHSA